MDILKTFELFLSEPISIIHKRCIKVRHIETNVFAQKIPPDIKIDDGEIQLTIYNNKKAYKLLSTVLKNKKIKDENNESKIHNERSELEGVSLH